MKFSKSTKPVLASPSCFLACSGLGTRGGVPVAKKDNAIKKLVALEEICNNQQKAFASDLLDIRRIDLKVDAGKQVRQV